MNILHIISRLDSYDAIFSVLDLSKHLNENGHNCIIVSSIDYKFKERFKAKCFQVPFYEIDVWRVCQYLKKIIKENDIDIVHTHSEFSSWVALFVSRNTNRPLVTTCHNFYSKNIFKSSVVLGKKVIVHHEAVGRHLMDRFNLPRQRLQFLRPALDLESFTFQTPDARSKTDFNIGIISPLHPDKGHEHFLKAMVKVVRTIPNIKIWIATSMPGSKQNFKGDLDLWIRRLSLNNFIEFFDASKLDISILSKFNILVFFPIKEDSSTRIILESQAQGVPVIASHVGAVSEVVLDNKTGILVAPKDHHALANAIIRLLKDFPLQKEIAFLARNKIEEQFSLSKRVNEFIEVYKETKNTTKILVINLGKAQDVIVSIPALRILKKKFGQDRVVSLTHTSLRTLLQHCPYIDEFLMYDSLSKNKGLFGFIEIIKILISEKFDIVFDFSNTFITHLLSYLTLASRRYGYKDRNFKFLINYGVEKPSGFFDSLEQKLSILTPLGTDNKNREIELWPSGEDTKFIDNFFGNHWVGSASIVGLDMSTQKGFLNIFRTLEYMAYLCDRLANKDFRVIVMGLKNNLRIKEQLFKKMKSRPILVDSDISVMQWISLIKRCNIYISSNPESLNIASLMKVPSIILTTKRNFNKLSVYNKDTEVLTNEQIQFDMHKLKGRRYSLKSSTEDVVSEKINRLMKRK